jgi:hypothetical protein
MACTFTAQQLSEVFNTTHEFWVMPGQQEDIALLATVQVASVKAGKCMKAYLTPQP